MHRALRHAHALHVFTVRTPNLVTTTITTYSTSPPPFVLSLDSLSPQITRSFPIIHSELHVCS